QCRQFSLFSSAAQNHIPHGVHCHTHWRNRAGLWAELGKRIGEADEPLGDLLKRAARSADGHPLRPTALRGLRTYSGLHWFWLCRRIVGEEPVVPVEHPLLAPLNPDVVLCVLGVREPVAVEQLAVLLRSADAAVGAFDTLTFILTEGGRQIVDPV